MGKRVKGNGNLQTQSRNVSRAENIKVSGSIDVELLNGPTSVKVEADENIIPYIVTQLNDGWLVVKFKDRVNISTENPVRVYITTPAIGKVRVDGSGDVTSSAKFSSDREVQFAINGSGDISANVHMPKVDVDLKGSGSLTLAGETRDVNISILGSGDYKGDDLKAENAKISVIGSGDAMIFSDGHLNAKITGSGVVRYKGNASVETKITGSGSVEKSN